MDSFTFAEEIIEQDSEFFMGSLDVDSLFTNIPLEETINICANILFEYTARIEGLSKNNLRFFFISCYKRILFYF